MNTAIAVSNAAANYADFFQPVENKARLDEENTKNA